jgi:hypothetical protein
MAGSWNTVGRFWMEPGKLPVESSGRSEQKMMETTYTRAKSAETVVTH